MALSQCCTLLARRAIPSTGQRFSLSSLSPGASSSSFGLCGRGDKKTKRGKRFKGSFGSSRPTKEELRDRFKDKIEVPRSTPWPLPFKVI